MRTIERGAIPQCLGRQPAGQDWRHFMGTECHATVHDCLLQEQHGLCCYCELETDADDRHIEHMEPRSKKQTRIYDYTNLALSCNGGAERQHCGHYKDNGARKATYKWDSTRFVPPDNALTVKLFQYLFDGSIVPTEEDSDRATYLIGYLGLNCPRLAGRRRAHARALMDTVGEATDSILIAWLLEEYLCVRGDGRLRQFHSLSKAIFGRLNHDED